MTITNGYATQAEIKAAQGIISVNATDDTYIDDLINAASRYIDLYTGRRFWTTAVDETRTYHADYLDMLMIDDCLSVTTLKTDNDGDHVYETTWASTDFDLMPSNAPLYPRPYTWIKVSPYGFYPFPPWGLGVQIVGKFGFCAIANRPPEINIACREIVAQMYQNRSGNTTNGAASMTASGVVVTPNDFPESAIQILNQYRKLY